MGADAILCRAGGGFGHHWAMHLANEILFAAAMAAPMTTMLLRKKAGVHLGECLPVLAEMLYGFILAPPFAIRFCSGTR